MAEIEIKQLEQKEIEKLGIKTWPVWEKERSVFEWEYDGTEECYILEGEVEVTTDKATYTIRKGDFVTFQDGLKCRWNVLSGIRKHYNFP